MDKQLKSLKKDLDQYMLHEITMTTDEKKRIFQKVLAQKKPKLPIGYYATLVATAVLICIFTLSQIDLFSKKDPGKSDDDPAILVPDEEKIPENPVEEKEPPPPIQEKEPVEESPDIYEEAPIFYETEDGEFKLKLTKDSDRGIGIGDSMEEVLEIFGEPDDRPFDEATPNNPIFHYSNEEVEMFSIIFTEGPEPKVDFVNTFYYSNPVSEESFYTGSYDYILDLKANINIYDDVEIVFYSNNTPLYNMKLLNIEKHQDGPTMKEAYDAEELTLEEFLEKISENGMETEVIRDEEVPELITGLYDGLVQTFWDLGEKHNWDKFENPADFEILKPELLNYASNSFTTTELKELSNNLYVATDAKHLPDPSFHSRLIVTEKTNDKIIVSTIEVGNHINPSRTVDFTLVKEDGKWVIDSWNRIIQDIHLSWEEYKAYIEPYTDEVIFLSEKKSEDGKIVYVFYIPKNEQVAAIYASNGIDIVSIPEEWIPEEYR
ncbi:hypothetical protein ACFVAD_01010 [Sutcliffiella sp. NPDC057660]|uniref:hypothetical protein n=1 Tax=Sutcliffiella sp. NPDC057660 TaxID=3346199 RepID=UPI0036D1FC1A